MTGVDYDPLQQPFELPLVSAEYDLVTRSEPGGDEDLRPEGVAQPSLVPRLRDPSRLTAQLSKRLSAAIAGPLLRMACPARATCETSARRCGAHAEQGTFECPVHSLSRQRCEVLGHDFASPVQLNWPSAGDSGAASRLSITAWGRRAGNRFDLVRLALQCVSEDGLLQSGETTKLSLIPRGSVLRASLAERVARTFEHFESRCTTDGDAPAAPTLLRLELSTPLARVTSTAAAIAAAAGELVRWDLFDRGLTKELGIRRSEALAREARGEAEAALEGLQQRAALEYRRLPAWRSVSTGQVLRLGGLIGHVRIHGELQRALPWIVAFCERGGARRGFGLSQAVLHAQPSAAGSE